jgi:nucleoside-diphosphate-sugar epimerase
LDEIERIAGLKLQRFPTPIHRFYRESMFKWVVKMLVRHPEREMPSYRDWESRTQKARFDCAKAKQMLGWRPVADRAELMEQGIAAPVREWLA